MPASQNSNVQRNFPEFEHVELCENNFSKICAVRNFLAPNTKTRSVN